jgi:hypothetical protein
MVRTSHAPLRPLPYNAPRLTRPHDRINEFSELMMSFEEPEIHRDGPEVNPHQLEFTNSWNNKGVSFNEKQILNLHHSRAHRSVY